MIRPSLAPLLLAALLVPAWEAEALDLGVGDAVEARFDELVDALVEQRQSPLAVSYLIELERHTRWVPFPALAEALTPVVEADDTDPVVRATAAHRVARALLAAGDVEGSEALVAREGYLTNWSIIGPFPNEAMSGFDTAYGPELRRHPDDRFPGRHGEVGWRDVSGLSRAGYLDAGRLAPPGLSSIIYAVSRIDTRTALDAQLWTSIDGAYTIWLNGELVAQVDADLGGAAVREWWSVRLRRGANELVVKIAGGETAPGAYVRLTDPDGGRLEGWLSTAVLEPSDGALASAGPGPDEAGRVIPRPSGSVLLALDDVLAEGAPASGLPADEALLRAALIARSHYPRDAGEPWRRFVQASPDGAGGCLDGSPRALLLCGQVADHYWERHRALTRAAEASASLDGDDESSLWAWTHYELAELMYGAIGDSVREQVRERCDAILERDPDFVPARLLRARIIESERQRWRAHRIFTEVLEAAPDSPEALYQAQWGFQQAGTTPELLELYRRSLQTRWDEPSAASTLARALARAGRIDEAVGLLDRSLEVRPLSLGIYWLKADLLASDGRPDEAVAVLRETLELFPGSAMAWEELGRRLVADGQVDEATAAFEQALAIEPQNQALAQYRQALVTDEEAFYSAYRLGLDELAALELPDELAEGRDYTVVAQQRIARVYPNGLYSQYVQEVFRVQSRLGADSLREYAITFTPDDETIEILSARIIKPDGTILESFDRWEESLSQPWYGLYYDYRALVLGFDTLAPGDVLEVEYTLSNVSQRNIFDDYYGAFVFVQDQQPKAFVRVGVLTPPDMTLHVRPPHLPHEAITRDLPASAVGNGGGRLTLFELRDVPHVELEPSMPGRSSVADHLHLSTFETWGEVSAWYWNLVEDQLVTSPEIARTVDELTLGLDSTEAIVAAVHEYVVRNTRYVGLEFGIHGYRPYRTTVSFARRFGDCKDTASLIKVMLGLAGVEAHLVLLRTRDLGALERDPPSLSVFNHAIAYVPELDLYLDGTAGYSGVDELPHLDQGASILIVEDGADHYFGELPYLPASTNRLAHSYAVDLTTDEAPATARIEARGQFAPPMRVRYESEENRAEEFGRDFTDDFPGAVIEGLEMAGLDDINEPVVASFEFSGAAWRRGTEERPAIRPLGLTSDIARRLAGSATRRQPLMLEFPFEVSYRVEYTLPDGLGIGDELIEHAADSPFGTFRLVMTPTDRGVSVAADMSITTTQVTVEDYPAFREFLQAVDQAINQNVTLQRQNVTLQRQNVTLQRRNVTLERQSVTLERHTDAS